MMKNGDLSNRGGIKIAFRMEDCILKRKPSKAFTDVLRNFNSLYGYELDMTVLKALEHIFRSTDINLVCVVQNSNIEKPIVKSVLESWYGEVFTVTKQSQIISALKSKEFEYYIDNNEQRLNQINCDGAVTFKEFREKCMRV